LLCLVIKLRVLVGFRILLRRVAKLSQTFLSCGSNEVGEHVVDATLRVDKILLALALDLNFATHNSLNHVNGLFIFTRFLLHSLLLLDLFNSVESPILQIKGFSTFKGLVNLFCLHVFHNNLLGLIFNFKQVSASWLLR